MKGRVKSRVSWCEGVFLFLDSGLYKDERGFSFAFDRGSHGHI